MTVTQLLDQSYVSSPVRLSAFTNTRCSTHFYLIFLVPSSVENMPQAHPTSKDSPLSFDRFARFVLSRGNPPLYRVSSVNSKFALCPSYSSEVIVPAAVDDSLLARAARFRAGGRFPVLSYLHPVGMVLHVSVWFPLSVDLRPTLCVQILIVTPSLL